MKSAKVVPGMPVTVTPVCRPLETEDGTACLHITVVALDHAVVVQSASATEVVGVGSMEAKLRPLIVAVAPPLVGALPLLTRVCDRVGAANGALVNLERMYSSRSGNNSQRRRAPGLCRGCLPPSQSYVCY